MFNAYFVLKVNGKTPFDEDIGFDICTIMAKCKIALLQNIVSYCNMCYQSFTVPLVQLLNYCAYMHVHVHSTVLLLIYSTTGLCINIFPV